MTGIVEWYRDRTLLVTGGSGFMGKVLLEKLLRSLPHLKRVYVLLRAKHGQAPAARLDSMTKLPLFEMLRRDNPSVLRKLVAVEADILQPGLNLKPKDQEALLEEVSVVFHCAASLRLEADLKTAVQHNTTGTQQVLELCEKMPHLEVVEMRFLRSMLKESTVSIGELEAMGRACQAVDCASMAKLTALAHCPCSRSVLMHVSTSFCHCEQEILEERIYPTPVNPHDIMRAVEWMDDASIKAITPQLLGPHPNCYTFSKRLAESLVHEQEGKLPVVIVRPSIVSPTLKEPIQGWVDTLNGPIGLVVGAGKGVIRSLLCGPDFYAEMIPVDVAVNAMIIMAWDTAVQKKEMSQMPVYNLSTSSLIHITWGEVLERGRNLVYENPFEGTVWYPDGKFRTNRLMHNLCILFLHILPAYFIDFLLLLARQKRFMVRLQNRISTGLEVLQYFTMRQWNFKNTEALKVSSRLSEKEMQTFYMANVEYDIDAFFLASILGARQYCMKEPLSSLPRARRHLKLLYVLDRATKFICLGLFLYMVYHCTNSFKFLLHFSDHHLHDVPFIGALIDS